MKVPPYDIIEDGLATALLKYQGEYIGYQLEEEYASASISIKEFTYPFTGSKK